MEKFNNWKKPRI